MINGHIGNFVWRQVAGNRMNAQRKCGVVCCSHPDIIIAQHLIIIIGIEKICTLHFAQHIGRPGRRPVRSQSDGDAEFFKQRNQCRIAIEGDVRARRPDKFGLSIRHQLNDFGRCSDAMNDGQFVGKDILCPRAFTAKTSQLVKRRLVDTFPDMRAKGIRQRSCIIFIV